MVINKLLKIISSKNNHTVSIDLANEFGGDKSTYRKIIADKDKNLSENKAEFVLSSIMDFVIDTICILSKLITKEQKSILRKRISNALKNK